MNSSRAHLALSPVPAWAMEEADRLRVVGFSFAEISRAFGRRWSPHQIRLAVERAQREASR